MKEDEKQREKKILRTKTQKAFQPLFFEAAVSSYPKRGSDDARRRRRS